MVPLASDVSLDPSNVQSKPESPTMTASCPDPKEMNRTALPVGNRPVILRALNAVPLYRRMTPPPPPARAYAPLGSHDTANRGCPVPVGRTLIEPEARYSSAVPLSPTSRAELPSGFQLMERRLFVLVFGSWVRVVPSYFRRTPACPPMSA